MRTISPASARGSAENILLGKKAKTFSLKRGAPHRVFARLCGDIRAFSRALRPRLS